MTNRGARTPLPPASDVREYINEAQRWHERETGKRLPEKYQQWTWESGTGETITLYGERLGQGEIAEYRGKHGHWYAGISHRGSGKPRQAAPIRFWKNDRGEVTYSYDDRAGWEEITEEQYRALRQRAQDAAA